MIFHIHLAQLIQFPFLKRIMKKTYRLLFVILSLALTACSTSWNNLPGVYTLDIQQGNIINQKMVDQLKPKMTKRQVLYIMGSSMLVDVFHQERWDYLYSEQLDGEPRKQKRLSLFFNGDILSSIQGDFRPTKNKVVSKSEETTLDIPPRDLDQTLWEKITGLFSSDNNTRKTSEIAKNKTRGAAAETKDIGTSSIENEF